MFLSSSYSSCILVLLLFYLYFLLPVFSYFEAFISHLLLSILFAFLCFHLPLIRPLVLFCFSVFPSLFSFASSLFQVPISCFLLFVIVGFCMCPSFTPRRISLLLVVSIIISLFQYVPVFNLLLLPLCNSSLVYVSIFFYSRRFILLLLPSIFIFLFLSILRISRLPAFHSSSAHCSLFMLSSSYILHLVLLLISHFRVSIFLFFFVSFQAYIVFISSSSYCSPFYYYH